MADAVDDPYLAVYVGETLDLFSWPVFTDAAKKAATFGDFFYRFSAEAGNQASSVKMRLDTDGKHATFRAHRVFEPDMSPAQADAFYVGLFRSIFQRCAGTQWDPKAVSIRTCDPEAIPPNYHQLMISQGDRLGCTIRFPQEWLSLPFNYQDFKQRTDMDIRYQSPPRSLSESIRQALLPHIHLTDLTADHAAELCGYDKRALGRKLHVMGTTLTKEIAHIKEELTVRALLDTNESIADIAASVGFSDASVFTRSFRKWTGVSPREYRKMHNTR
jgi:AraC-like DNA-binding protein